MRQPLLFALPGLLHFSLAHAVVPPNAPAPAPPSAKPPAAPASAYSGHGAESVPAALLEKYRPQPLPAELSRHIQAMFDVRAPGMGMVALDGKALYFSWNVTGVPQIWKLDGPDKFPRQLTGGEDNTQLAGVTPDGRTLIVQRDRKGEENPGLYFQDSAGGPLVEIQHKAGVQTLHQRITDDGRWEYFRANDVQKDSYAIYRVEVATRKRETVWDKPGIWSLADVAADGKMLLEKQNGGLWMEYWEYDPATKAERPLFGQGEKEEYVAACAAAPGEFLVLTNKLGDFRRLYRFAGGTFTPLSPESTFDVVSFSIDRARLRILYDTNEGGYIRQHGLDAHTFKPITLPRLPDADNSYRGATTFDGRFTPFSIDDGVHPVQSFVYDWKSKKLERWHAGSAPEIDTTKFARAKLESYPARDGTQVPALVRRPAACEQTLCPVVMSFHGGPESQSRPGFNPSAQLFVDAGFIYVEPNVRGSDGYGKKWIRADDGPKRLDVITDIDDASKWAKSRFAVGGKAPKVGIFGGSYGGYSVLMGMTLFAGAYDAGVDIVGISDLRTFLKNTAPYRRILRISEYGDPDKDAEALAKLSPMTFVDRTKAPLAILQGATDPRVPAGEAIQIHDALEKKGVPTELMIFPDEGHGAQKRENRVLMFGHAIAWFEKYLR